MIRYKAYFVLALSFVLFLGCKEEDNGGGTSGSGGSSLSGEEASLLDYFYDLDGGETVDVKFYRKDPTTLANPGIFEPEEDTLNFSTTDYILSIEQGAFEAAICEEGVPTCESGEVGNQYSTIEECEADTECDECSFGSEDIVYASLSDCNNDDDCVDCAEFTDLSLIARQHFDETQDGQCTEISPTTCPDLDGDGILTDQGVFEDLYKSGTVSFSYDYKDLRKMEWNDENDRYMVVMGPKITLEQDYTYDDDPLSNPQNNVDRFDSLVYVVTVDANNYSGFSYTDENDNGIWDSTEDFTVGENLGYFDSSEWTRVEDDYSTSYLTFPNVFEFNRITIAEDSLMFRVVTDCNDNGKWDSAEPIIESECVNGKWYDDANVPFCDVGNLTWDTGEPIIHENTEENGTDGWEYGELYQDRNCNGYWDGPESTNEAHCIGGVSDGLEYETTELCESDVSCTECESLCQNGFWVSDVDTPFCDVGNGIKDDNEYCYCDETLEDGATCSAGDNTGITYNSMEECESACELCTDGITPDCVANPITNCSYQELYSMSDRPEQLLVSYQIDPEGTSGTNQYPLYSIIDPIDESSTVLPRWGDNSLDVSQGVVSDEDDLKQDLLDSVSDSYSEIKYIPDLDSTVVVYSNQIVEALGSGFEDNYHITKTVWYEESQTPGVYDRFYDYHLLRVGDDGNIYELVHNHYLTLDYNQSLSQLPAEFYENYLDFDEQATEEVYIHSVGGMLRDGERINSYNEMQYNPNNFGWYSVDKEYKVDLEDELDVPLRKLIGCDCSTENICIDNNLETVNNSDIWFEACSFPWEYDEDETACLASGNIWDSDSETCYSINEGVYCHSLGRIADSNLDEIDDIEECSLDSTLTDCYKITRTVKKTLIGPGIENVQENTTWLAKGLGIVRDQLYYRFNEPSDWEGLYLLEMANKNSSRSSSQRGSFGNLFNAKKHISKNQIGQKAGLDYDPYQKTAKFGLQRMKIGVNRDGK